MTDRNEPARPSLPWTILLVLLILTLGGGVVYAIFYFEPTATRSESTRETAMLVETTHAERGT